MNKAKIQGNVLLSRMSSEEYEAFYQMSFENHVNELIVEEHMSPEEARRETAGELLEMLPDGLHTENNYLMTIRKADEHIPVGYIWTLHEDSNGIRQSFLCDLVIYEEFRRKGLAQESLWLMERSAVESGCEESVLFVKNSNTEAIALYEKCGYIFLRDINYGRFMKKRIGENS